MTEEQRITQDRLVETFKDEIHPKNGHQHNLRTVRKIALAAGLKNPYIDRHVHWGCTIINCETVDPGGTAEDEIRAIYRFCLWLKANYSDL